MHHLFSASTLNFSPVLLLAPFCLAVAGCHRPDPPPPPSPLTNSIALFKQPWDSTLATHKWPVAEPIAEICEKAYQPVLNAKGAFDLLGFDHVYPVTSDSMFGYVLQADDVMVIAFRGTEVDDVGDWIADLKFFQAPVPPGHMPIGFADGYKSLKDKIVKIKREATPKPKYLWVTGHSLGAALALACAHDIDGDDGVKVTGLMTFGQPRAADKPLGDDINSKFGKRYARFVNGSDIVTRLPPAPFIHCGTLIRFDEDATPRAAATESKGTRRPKMAMARPGDAPQLSDAEFKELQEKMKTKKMMMRAGTHMDHAQFESILSPFTDHPMAQYHQRIREMLAK